MAIVRLEDISLSIGTFPLLDRVTFQIEPMARIALIGRNGEGKSTLLRIIAGQEAPDSGVIHKDAHCDIALLLQTLLPDNEKTVYEAVAEGLLDLSDLIKKYHHYTLKKDVNISDERWLNRVSSLQNEIEQKNGWLLQQRIERIITELNLPAETLMSSLSGGWRRRVGLAQVLVRQPDLLLLDEPTNHLDLETIQWLEQTLLNYPKAILFITHDRALLRKIATGILELDRGHCQSFGPDYDEYLKRKYKLLEDETKQNIEFDKKLAKEEVWIRQGIKARRTRNEGRVRALEALRRERTQRQEQRKKPSFSINEMVTKGKVAFEIDKVTFQYEPNKPLIDNFSHVIQKGDKIALVGPNGIGKSTLVNILMGNILPQTGNIKPSPTNQIAFFDQNRYQIDGTKTVFENVAKGDDFVEKGGKRQHIIGYLGEFMFSPQKVQSLASALSGGECNRLLLAKLFAKPSNVLVLDEPTNDLDIESLEILETLLLNYAGTVIIISHDREFIDNVATHCFYFEGNGKIGITVGGYNDMLSQMGIIPNTLKPAATPSKQRIGAKERKGHEEKKKFGYNELRELSGLPEKIEKLEQEINSVQAKMTDPLYYSQASEILKEDAKKLQNLKDTLKASYERWEALELFSKKLDL